MKEITILTIISGLEFLVFVAMLVLGLRRQNVKLKAAALVLFLIFIGLVGWTGFRVVGKSYNKAKGAFRARTGEEIYEALFEEKGGAVLESGQRECTKVLNYQDQVVPKVDYAIWLHFETCPEGLNRILSKHIFTSSRISAASEEGKFSYGEGLTWFNPATLGDTIMVYEYSAEDSRNIQTIWSNLDSTRVFVRDIFD